MKQFVMNVLVLVSFSHVIISCSNHKNANMSGSAQLSWNEVYPLDKGAYLSSDYLSFKEKNLRDDLYSEDNLSEKVKFKAFVKHEEKYKP